MSELVAVSGTAELAFLGVLSVVMMALGVDMLREMFR